jgi:hypothetical protein
MAKFREQYVVDGKGGETAVIIPVKEYEELLEGIHDLAIITEHRDEPTMTFEELKKKLRAVSGSESREGNTLNRCDTRDRGSSTYLHNSA